MAVVGKIAKYARAELPLTWDALATSPDYGDSLLELRVSSIQIKLFGQTMTETLEQAIDERVAEYAGKLLAIEIINPGIDYWAKQALSVGATGRNENKSYSDRSAALTRLRTYLLEQTRLMWPEVEGLLPGRRNNRVGSIPRVRDIENAHTPNPYDFEEPFAPKTGTGTTGEGTA